MRKSFGQATGVFRGAMAALILAAAGNASAADYPTRPITLIVSHVPGGPSDVLARVLSRLVSGVLRQPLVIENRPGAAGSIAAEQAANADPDGYTLLMGNTGMLATNPVRQKSVSFDPELDFAAITLLGTQANVLVVNPQVPADSLKELVAFARSQPRLLTFASAGHGSPSHLAGEMFKAEAKIDIVHVPYKKPGPALQDVIAGHVKMMFAPASLVANHVRAGRLNALAVGSAKRSPILPQVPTIADLGYPDFDATTWYGLVAPAGTPKEIIDTLHHSTAVALEDAESRKIMAGFGLDVVASTPRAFEAYIKAQIPKWAAVIRNIDVHSQ